MYEAAFKVKPVELAEKSGNRRAEKENRIREKPVGDWRKKIALTMLPR